MSFPLRGEAEHIFDSDSISGGIELTVSCVDNIS